MENDLPKRKVGTLPNKCKNTPLTNIGSGNWDTMAEAITASAEASVGHWKPLREVECLSHHRKELNRDQERLASMREHIHKEDRERNIGLWETLATILQKEINMKARQSGRDTMPKIIGKGV